MDDLRLITPGVTSTTVSFGSEPDLGTIVPRPETPVVSPSSPIKHDVTYFLEQIMFSVNGRLFNVPNYHFVRSSPTFMLENDPEGVGCHTPIILEGVSELDFERLLSVMYPLEIVVPVKSKEEWISVLKLSTRWRFNTIRKFSIEQLVSVEMDPVQKVILAKDYGVSDWLRSGYQELSLRSKTLSLDEAENIGYPTAFSLFVVREKIVRIGNGSVGAIVRSMFAVELEVMELTEERDHGFTRVLKPVVEDLGATSNSMINTLWAGPVATAGMKKKKTKHAFK